MLDNLMIDVARGRSHDQHVLSSLEQITRFIRSMIHGFSEAQEAFLDWTVAFLAFYG